MAILEYARTIQELSKFNSGGLPHHYTYYASIPSTHSILQGKYSCFQDFNAYTSIEGRFAFDFSASPDKPVLGDVFGFRFSRCTGYKVDSNSTPTANQWIYQFKDASGNTIGGLRQSSVVSSSRSETRTYQLMAGGTSVSISGETLYGSTSISDYAITCEVTAAEIVVSMLYANNEDSIEANPMSLIASVTADNSTLNYGPVEVMKITPNIATSTAVVYPDQRSGSDISAYVGCIFAVNEDFANLFVTNVLAFTSAGAELTDLPLLSPALVTTSEGRSVFSAYFNATRDARRTFKVAPAFATPFPTGMQVVRAEIDVTYGLSVAGKTFLGDASELEFFARYSGVNYSYGNFGNDSGSRKFTIDYNPGTLAVYDSYAAMEFGIVLREKP